MNTGEKKEMSFNHEAQNSEILKYLHNDMSADEKEVFERKLAEDPFLAESMEGLQMMDQQAIEKNKQQLDIALKHQIRQEKRKQRNKFAGVSTPTLLAVFLILALIIIGWVIIKKLTG